MTRGLARLALSLAIAVSTLAPAWAQTPADLAVRKELVAELMAIVPYSDADAEREAVDGMVVEFRKKFGDRMTPYAEGEARAATLEAWRKVPSVTTTTREMLEAKLSVEELREAIAFTRSPIALKMRAAPPQGATESQADYISRVMTPDEFQAFLVMIQQPGTMRYLTVIKEAAQPMGQDFGEHLWTSLSARCPKKTAPLPWCA